MTLATSQRTRSAIAFATGGLLLVALLLDKVGQPIARDLVLVAGSVLAGVPIAIRAWQALRARAFSIDLLVTVAVGGALVIGEYVESAVVSFLFLFGAWLEARTLERTRSSLRELIDLAPQRATVLRNGERVVIDAEHVEAGELVLVTTGEKIAVDGVVASGTAFVDEATITGEPVPVAKQPGDPVFAGTLTDSGYLEVTAERVGDDTAFARIIELVEDAQESKTRTQRFLERFARVYTPAILVLAGLVYAVTRDVELALVFLVIACPGALVISVPVAVVAGLGNAARHGVLVKGGESLERLAAADALVLDKTGTLTVGRPVVTEVLTIGGQRTDELLHLMAAVESASEHHLGRAIVAAARERGLPTHRDLGPVMVHKGQGIAAEVAGRHVVVGGRALLESHGIGLHPAAAEHLERQEADGNTVVLAAVDDSIAGLVSIADATRDEAAAALTSLREGGIREIHMLTGDNPHTAQLVAGRLGIDAVHARLLPEDKVTIVRELQATGLTVAMVGDGVNDAPALATADVGVAMGAAGTDVSMETADVVLMTDRLDQLAHAQRLARATVQVMRQNTALALTTVLVLVLGVLLDVVHLAGGMLVHEASVLLVILNALRLVRLRGPRRRNGAVAASERPVAEKELV